MTEQIDRDKSDSRGMSQGFWPFAGRFAYPLIILALVVILYAPSFKELVRILLEDSNSSHGLLVPPIALFIVFKKRKSLAEIPKESNSWALLLVLAGAILLPLATAAEVLSISLVSFLLVLGGIVWHVWGSRVMRVLLFPYLFLFFTIPWPGLLVETLTFYLQLISARSASAIINLMGIEAIREGVEIHLGGYTFAVAAPCSGMRSLAALMALGTLCAYMLKGNLKRRILLVVAVIPLAMIGNSLRIVVVLLIAKQWGAKAAEGFYHEFSGLVLFLITFMLLLGMGRLIGMKQMREDL